MTMCMTASRRAETEVSGPRAQFYLVLATILIRLAALHFKLSVGEDVTGESYEDHQFTYRPQLDPSRDRELMELLPEYLTEEITFPRPHAAKFYARVTKALTERLD